MNLDYLGGSNSNTCGPCFLCFLHISRKKASDFLCMGHRHRFNQECLSFLVAFLTKTSQMGERSNSPKKNGAAHTRREHVPEASQIKKVAQWFSHGGLHVVRNFIISNSFTGITSEILHWQSYKISV